jgi:transcriptional regulator with XRE-family HTH domain
LGNSQETIDNIYDEIIKRIVKERKHQGIIQEKLAALSDIDRTHMGLIEQGRRRPTLATLHKITKTLKLRWSSSLKSSSPAL